MDLEWLRLIKRKPGVIAARTTVRSALAEQRLERRGVVLKLIPKNKSIGQMALVNKCRRKGIGQETTIKRDVASLAKAGLINITVNDSGSYKSFDLVAV